MSGYQLGQFIRNRHTGRTAQIVADCGPTGHREGEWIYANELHGEEGAWWIAVTWNSDDERESEELGQMQLSHYGEDDLRAHWLQVDGPPNGWPLSGSKP